MTTIAPTAGLPLRPVPRAAPAPALDSPPTRPRRRDEFMGTAEEIFGKDMAEKLFARLDGDRDGRLSKEEIEADLENGEGVFAEVFRKLFDCDGKVTQGEFRLGTAGRVDHARATRFFNGMDRTGDGGPSPREMR
jgi:hypothetical protein